MIEYLFVYGSLLSKLNHPMTRELQNNATLLGEARCAGRLYRIAWYPGIVEAATATEFVHGEIFHIHNPTILALLDEYEGINPEYPTKGEYRRVFKNVVHKNQVLEAYVYHYQGKLKGLRRIKSGDFLSDLTEHFE